MKGKNLCFSRKFKEPVHKASLVEKPQRSLYDHIACNLPKYEELLVLNFEKLKTIKKSIFMLINTFDKLIFKDFSVAYKMRLRVMQ